PSPEDGAVYVGEFRGGYKYSRAHENDGYPHQRKVNWLLDKSPIPRSKLPHLVVRSLKAHQSIFSAAVDAVSQLLSSGAGMREVDTDGVLVGVEGDVVRRLTLQT